MKFRLLVAILLIVPMMTACQKPAVETKSNEPEDKTTITTAKPAPPRTPGQTRPKDDDVAKSEPKTDDNAKSEPNKIIDPAEALATVQSLTADFDESMRVFMEKYQSAPRDEQAKLRKDVPKPASVIMETKEIAEGFPGTEVEAYALAFEAANSRSDSEAIVEKLFENHIESSALVKVIPLLGRMKPSKENIARIESVLEQNKNHDVQGVSMFTKIQMDGRIADMQEQLVDADEDTLKQYNQFLGEETVSYIKAYEPMDEEKLVSTLEKIRDEFGDVKSMRDKTLAELAEPELFEIKNLSIGKVAPDIVAEDIAGEEFKLSDYRGKVVMLDFWGDW